MESTNVIKSVTLSNFMCHKNLKIDFTKPITVIGGFNGSGKSAIMIAIGIIFGLRSSKLERGPSLKTLILNGKSTATIELVLNNENHRYNYVIFGPEIKIEKVIRYVGASSLKIKGENNKIFSTKKEDLDFILSYFHLHVDNPLNFQTQENSKKFLKNSKPENLYELFLRGTELDDITHLHDEIRTKTDEMKEKLDLLSVDLSEIKKRRNQAVKDLNLVLEGAKLDNTIVQLRRELEWTKLYKILEDRKTKNEEINTYDQEIKKAREKISQNNMEIQQLVQEEYEKENQINNMKESLEIRKRELNESIQTYTLDEHEMKTDFEEIQKQIDGKTIKLKHIRKLGGLEQLNDKMKELEEENTSNKEKKAKLNEKMLELEKEENRLNETQRELSTLRQKEGNLNRQIQYLKRIESDKFSFFHPKMKSILDEIQHTDWKQEVIGPIGIHLQLKNDKWKNALSVILKNTLSDFLVFNKEDKFKLKRIFEHYKANISIILPSKSEDAPISYYKVKTHLVALNVLDITYSKKYIVMNHLIMSSNLERILLLNDRAEAHSLLRNRTLSHHKYPVNVAYLENGDKIEFKDGYLSDFRPRVQQLYFEHNEKRLKRYINEKDQILAQIKMLKKSDKTSEIQAEIDQFTNIINESNQKIADLKIQTSLEVGDDIDQDIARLNDEISNLIKQKDEMEINMTQLSNSKVNANKELKENFQTFTLNTSDYQKKVNTLQMDNNILSRKLTTIYERITRKKSEEKDLLDSFTTKAEILNKEIPKIENARSQKAVQEKIRECEIKKEIYSSLEKEETIQSDLKELNEIYEHKNKIVCQFREKIKSTIDNIKLRISKREELKLSTAEEIRKIFQRLTGKRNYDGDLDFSHENQKLELKMKVNIKAGDKNTLSGGERSFAAMCLILSIWPFIGCPVKILDEFDVFMDSVNRDTVLKELIDLFEQSGLQIILITPLSMKLKNVDYIMLKHPSRNV